MKSSRSDILLAALQMFATHGFDAVSLEQITDNLGMVKSSIYKHFKNKQDIFDSIIEYMATRDAEFTARFAMPDAASGGAATLVAVSEFSHAMFDFWTRDKFAVAFRHMMTVEQYKSPRMRRIYHQYFGAGPVEYTAGIFATTMGNADVAWGRAAAFFGIMRVGYDLYDNAKGKTAVAAQIHTQIDNFIQGVQNEIH